MTTAGETVYEIRNYDVLHYRSGESRTQEVATSEVVKGLHQANVRMDEIADEFKEAVRGTETHRYLNHTMSRAIFHGVYFPDSSVNAITTHFYVTNRNN